MSALSDENSKNKQNPFGDVRYNSFSRYCINTYGHKLYKLSLNGGMTCPNRDGTLGYGGCIFCSQQGSGDFAAKYSTDIDSQIEEAKQRIISKTSAQHFIAYFQSYTNTYAPVQYLEKIFTAAINNNQIDILSIATRPDCLGDDVLNLLEKLNKIKPVWVELGLQTIHKSTADFIRRGYDTPCFDSAVYKLKQIGCDVIVHTIIGLPFETQDMLLQTIEHISKLPIDGIKLQLLHILKNTDLGTMYQSGQLNNMGYTPLSLEQYTNLLISCIEHLPERIVIHRITGDGAKHELLAPLWSADKKTVLNYIAKQLRERDSWQGKYCDNNL